MRAGCGSRRKSHVKKDPAAGPEFRTELAAKLTPWRCRRVVRCACGCWTKCVTGCSFTRRVWGLPAYSPELNLIEGLWDQVKDSLCNGVFDTLAEIEVLLRAELQRFWRDARRVHSLVFDLLQAQANAFSRSILLLNERK